MVTIPDVSEEQISPCPACGASSWSKAGQVKDYSVSGEWFELRRCEGCWLKKTYPQPEEAKIGKYYASLEYISHSDTRKGLTNKLYHWARSFMMQQKYNWVKATCGKEKGWLLDVGAGTGHFAHYMQTHGWDVVALEPDESARKVASEKLGIRIEPLEALVHQKEQSFDVITLWHVLEHVYDIGGYMNHFHSLLTEDGSLIIAVPNHTSTDAKRYGSQWAAYDVPRHLWHFSPASMEFLFKKHGFEMTRQQAMPLDAFYVSLLSEKYNGNDFFGPVAAFVSGLKSYLKSRKHTERASSIIYTGKIQKTR